MYIFEWESDKYNITVSHDCITHYNMLFLCSLFSGKARGRPACQNLLPTIVQHVISRQKNMSTTPLLNHQHSGVYTLIVYLHEYS